MSSLVFLAAVLSLETTRILVSLGYGLGYDTDAAAASADGVGRFAPGFAPLAITNATNATPIVITTAYPHGVSTRGVGGMSCVIAGVLGNTAANNIAVDPNNSTVGLPEGVLAVPLSATTLALYGQEQSAASANVGRIVPLVGSGAYTSGGTITPALTDGSILLGRENVREHSSPPRIVLVPTASTWSPRSNAVPNGNRTAELAAMRAQRSLRTDRNVFEVHCWGQRNPPDAAYDFDVVKVLSHAVAEAAHNLFGVRHEPIAGAWDDQKEMATQHIKAGHLFTFTLAIDTPLLSNALEFVPATSAWAVTVQSPTPEVAAVIDISLP